MCTNKTTLDKFTLEEDLLCIFTYCKKPLSPVSEWGTCSDISDCPVMDRKASWW